MSVPCWEQWGILEKQHILNHITVRVDSDFFLQKLMKFIDRTKSILTAKYQVQKLGGLMADIDIEMLLQPLKLK